MIKGLEYWEGGVYVLAVQLLIISVFNIATKKKQNIFLAVLLLIYVDSARNSFIYQHLTHEFLKLIIGNIHLNLLYGPAIFLYLQSLTKPKIPFRIFLIHLIIPCVIVLSVLAYSLIYHYEVFSIGRNIFLYEIKFIIIVYYYYQCVRLIRSDDWKNVRQERRYRSFFYILGSFILYSGVDLLFLKHTPLRSTLTFLNYLDIFSYIIVYIYLVYYGLTELNWVKGKVINSKTQVDKELTGKAFEDLQKRLKVLFEKDRIHTNAEMNIRTLAEAANVPTGVLSDYLNVRLKKSFYDFINEKRVAEFKKNLFKPEHSHLDLIGIAYASGFNSKATFNRVFKKIEGITPREYRTQYQIKHSIDRS